MRKCEQCGAQVSDQARFCEQCGVKLPEPKNTNDKTSTPKSPMPEVNIDVVKERPSEEPGQRPTEQPEQPEIENGKADEIEELDLTSLDKEVSGQEPTDQSQNTKNGPQPKPEHEKKEKANDNIIDIKGVLESEEKVEADDSIKREVLADEEIFSKVCPMCGEDMQLNKKLLENTPVIVKCLKCGNETKIW